MSTEFPTNDELKEIANLLTLFITIRMNGISRTLNMIKTERFKSCIRDFSEGYILKCSFNHE